MAVLGGSTAWFPGNVGPNTGSIPADVQLGGAWIPLGRNGSPLGNTFGIGSGALLTSRTEATSAVDTDARAGALGANLSFQPGVDPSQPITVDLVAAGASVIPANLFSTAYLRFGAFAAETGFKGGTLQPDHYRVGQADLVFRSPAIKDAAAQLYQGIGGVDRQIEEIVSTNFDCTPIQAIVGGSFGLPKLTVHSNTRDKIFAGILARPLTSHNKVVTIDFSSGEITVHLDQLAAGGINQQPPNTELIDSKDYPLIATSVHDVMHDATNIVLGAIGNSLDAVTLGLTWSGPVGLPGDHLDVSWNFTLQQAITGKMPPAVSNSSGLLGCQLGAGLALTLNTIGGTSNAVGKLFRPAYDLILADAGNGVFDLLINQIKFGFTSTVVNTLQPAFQVAAQIVSVQVNHQTTGTCTNLEGQHVTNEHSIAALSVGLLQSSNAARLDCGFAATRVTLPSCH